MDSGASAASEPAPAPAAPAGSMATPSTPMSSGSMAPARTSKKAAATPNASDSEINSAKSSGMVWVNTDSGIYHKSGRWYGKTKTGKFMSEGDAKAAGYKESEKD